MSIEEPEKVPPDYEPPRGASSTATWNGVEHTATAKWVVLRKKEKPSAEIFSVSYVTREQDGDRPVTFVFNGGPGASSAYLHMGAVGPNRVAFPADGSLPEMPPRLVHNDESWLAFTDVVFVDPVGTGFSRMIEQENARNENGKKKEEAKKQKKDGDEWDPTEYFGYKRDLESLGEFIGRWLSGNGRWGSPVFIAGESYGGYRVGRLVRTLQESAGIGLNGAVLISPALEIGGLNPDDYAVTAWVDLVPTMAAAAVHHGRSRAFAQGTPVEDVQRAAEEFATGDYTVFLTRGASMPVEERARVLARFAELTGLSDELVTRAEGRIPIGVFVRELLRDERKVLGRYED